MLMYTLTDAASFWCSPSGLVQAFFVSWCALADSRY